MYCSSIRLWNSSISGGIGFFQCFAIMALAVIRECASRYFFWFGRFSMPISSRIILASLGIWLFSTLCRRLNTFPQNSFSFGHDQNTCVSVPLWPHSFQHIPSPKFDLFCNNEGV
ncbi:hypothetical protein GDO78_019333 [Eleutherodactylus coqui]|uniref:Uncharacterized protein n=1 Tax=Eleutherodactylus coqui TaxID=57060 RepID=A0A8J6C6L3_ELECQ|nr:hypothetical protein GDO78_019333 [Eleutherodactylus coqui]KAG9464827.1 hypothetical protein GDO78_019333 [Eleutherodactylus coqui]